MSNLHILREHALGLPKARKIAFAWAEHVESEFGMEHVTATRFELNAKLGLLLGAFKGRIEAEIVKNLDDLLAPKVGAHAGAAAAKHPAKRK